MGDLLYLMYFEVEYKMKLIKKLKVNHNSERHVFFMNNLRKIDLCYHYVRT